MSKSVFLDVFNVDNDAVDLNEDVKKESEVYAPKALNKDKPYVATVRLIPLPIYDEEGSVNGWNKKSPYHRRKRYYLKDEDGYGTYFDSPLTVDEPCPIQDTFFKLFYSDDVRKQKLAKDRFSISTHYWCLLYIIEDKQKPELEGKCKVFRFTKDIKELIKAEYDDESIKVWDFKNGKDLKLVVGEKSVTLDNGKQVTFPDYNIGIKTKFIGQGPLTIGNVPIDSNSAEVGAKLEELYDNAPKMSNYEYTPWDTETKDKVQNILDSYLKTFNKSSEKVADITPASKVEDNADTIMEDLDILDGDAVEELDL